MSPEREVERRRTRRPRRSIFVLLGVFAAAILGSMTVYQRTVGREADPAMSPPAVAGDSEPRAAKTADRPSKPDSRVPYAADSPWSIVLPVDVPIHPDSQQFVDRLASAGHFGSDPDQYTYPVYVVDDRTPKQTVAIRGRFSDVTAPDALTNLAATSITVPIPDHAAPSKGSDGSVIVWNPETGEEWGLWQLRRENGSWSARNGYRYDTAWSGVPPEGFVSRGAGLPYFAGLVRRWEVEDKAVEHALAFAYNYASPRWVYPATKSDGRGDPVLDLPEGARLQLDPDITEDEFEQWGLDEEGKILARALQRYGMIVIDNAGHPKVMMEERTTAGWGESGAPKITAKTVSGIPLNRFRVVDWDRWTAGEASGS